MDLIHALIAYLPAAVIVTLLPGPDTALVLNLAIRHGVTTAWRAAFGIGTGLMVWAAAVAAGLAGVLRASASVFEAFRWCCAAYLVYLAVSILIARKRGEAAAADTKRRRSFVTLPAGYRAGLLTATLNPKLGVFFVAMLPQFIPSGAPVAPYTIALIAMQAACAVGWYLTLALIARRGQRWLRHERVQRWMTRTTAGAFSVFGLRLAFLDR